MSGERGGAGGRSGRPSGQGGRPGAGRARASGGFPRGGSARGGSARGGSTRGGSTRGGAGAGGRAAARGQGQPRQPRQGPGGPVRPSPPQRDVHDPQGVRLQKLLAAAGVGSRRACELLIAQGRVEVDGQVVTELGVRVDPVGQRVHVDGVRVQLDASRVYLALNKPLGVVSTMSDELGRPSLGDLVSRRAERLFHVGRLDADTEGLILLTNDGELAHRLQHPSYQVPKTYVATVRGPVARDVGRRLRAGIELEDGLVAVDSFRLLDSAPGKALVEVVLHEGRKHVVRRVLEAVGHPVLTLSRVQVGSVRLGDLKPGKTRPLNSKEIGELYRAAGL